MPDLTQEQKDRLARFAGAEYYLETHATCNFWLFDRAKTKYVGAVKTTNWSPAENPAHGWMVLEALVEKQSWDRVLIMLVKGNLQCDEFGHKFDLWSKICKLALEVETVK